MTDYEQRVADLLRKGLINKAMKTFNTRLGGGHSSSEQFELNVWREAIKNDNLDASRACAKEMILLDRAEIGELLELASKLQRKKHYLPILAATVDRVSLTRYCHDPDAVRACLPCHMSTVRALFKWDADAKIRARRRFVTLLRETAAVVEEVLADKNRTPQRTLVAIEMLRALSTSSLSVARQRELAQDAFVAKASRYATNTSRAILIRRLSKLIGINQPRHADRRNPIRHRQPQRFAAVASTRQRKQPRRFKPTK